MADATKDFIYKNARALQQRAEKMFNKPKYCDTLFLVNSAKFHASSHLVSAASDALDSLLSTHFENCSDKEIKIFKVKYEDSFSVILKYIYGMDINFTKMQIAVMCEVISLCDTYELSEFSKDLKTYLSTLVSFNVDSAVVLLNTAKKTNLPGLYHKLSVFAYENAEKLLKHDSFVDLEYNVLVDLLKSDWFFALEINILKGSLMWHSDMYKDKSDSNAQDMVTTENRTARDFEDLKNDNTSHTSSESKLADVTDSEEGETKAEVYCKDSNQNKTNEDIANLDKTTNHNEVVKEFSDSVLKSLLIHIRLYNIPGLELVKACKTELFKKYLDYLGEDQNFSKSQVPRVQYVPEIADPSTVSSGGLDNIPDTNNSQDNSKDSRESDNNNVASNEPSILNDDEEEKNTERLKTLEVVMDTNATKDIMSCKPSTSSNIQPKSVNEASTQTDHVITPVINIPYSFERIYNMNKTFTVKSRAYNVMSTSNEVLKLGNFELKFRGKTSQEGSKYNLRNYLSCESQIHRDWEITVELKTTMVSRDVGFSNSVFPPRESQTSHISITFNYSARCKSVAWWALEKSWFHSFQENDLYTFDVHFKSIVIRFK